MKTDVMCCCATRECNEVYLLVGFGARIAYVAGICQLSFGFCLYHDIKVIVRPGEVF